MRRPLRIDFVAALLFFAVAVLAAAPARAQNVHTQMERVHDLAKQMFGLPVVYADPGTPWPDPCPCARARFTSTPVDGEWVYREKVYALLRAA